MGKEKDIDRQKDYRRITEKSLEERRKKSFYFNTVMILIMLLLFSGIGIFAHVGLKFSLLFIIIDGILILFLVGLIKYRKDRKMVYILGHASILVATETFMVGILVINARNLDKSSIGQIIFLTIILGLYAFILVVSFFRRYEELKREETSVSPLNQSEMESQFSIDFLYLKANWSPILSPVEWEYKTHELIKGTDDLTPFLILTGTFLVVIGFIIEEIPIPKDLLLLVGIPLILIGFITLALHIWAKKLLGKKDDIYLETTASWNITDFNVGKEAVENFLVERGLSYVIEKNEKVKYADYKYVLDSGTYIRLVFIVQKHPTKYFGRLGIGYKLLNYDEARKLRKELDEYLTVRDILLRKELMKKLV